VGPKREEKGRGERRGRGNKRKRKERERGGKGGGEGEDGEHWEANKVTGSLQIVYLKRLGNGEGGAGERAWVEEGKGKNPSGMKKEKLTGGNIPIGIAKHLVKGCLAKYKYSHFTKDGRVGTTVWGRGIMNETFNKRED